MKKFIFSLIVFVLLTASIAYSENFAVEFNNIGLKYFQENHYDLALEAYQKALNIEPNYTNALYNMAGVYLKIKEFDKAIEKLEKVVSLKPNDGDSYYHLAAAYYYSGKYNEAIRNYDKSQFLNFEPERTELLGDLLEPLRYREIDFKYSSLLDKKATKIAIKIKGFITTSDLLIKDPLNSLEPFAGVSKKGMFQNVEIRFLGPLSEEKGVEKLWILRWDDNTQKTFRVTYLESDVLGTNILITEEHLNKLKTQ